MGLCFLAFFSKKQMCFFLLVVLLFKTWKYNMCNKDNSVSVTLMDDKTSESEICMEEWMQVRYLKEKIPQISIEKWKHHTKVHTISHINICFFIFFDNVCIHNDSKNTAL